MEEYENVALAKECSALIQKKLLPKLKDLGNFSIPCVTDSTSFEQVLCDLGTIISLIALSLCKKLEMGELKPTIITLKLVDHFAKHPIGILEDIPIRVGKFFNPADFDVLEMEENSQIPIILGRPFLATESTIIDIKHGKLFLNVANETIEFDLSNPIEQSFLENSH